jgi:hypothetical protein
MRQASDCSHVIYSQRGSVYYGYRSQRAPKEWRSRIERFVRCTGRGGRGERRPMLQRLSCETQRLRFPRTAVMVMREAQFCHHMLLVSIWVQ